MVFMFLSACSFAMYYRVFRRRSLRVLWHNGEWRFFVLLVLLFSALIVIVLYPSGEYGLMETIRIALLSLSITTSGHRFCSCSCCSSSSWVAAPDQLLAG